MKMKPFFRPMPKTLAQESIKIPGSPFWNVLKRFGRDEAIAMFVNVIATFGLAFFTVNAFLLSIVGPIVEKIGFFPAHFKEAWGVYKTTPEAQRQSFFYYSKKAFKGGTKSLIEDILVHDPFYILFMFLGIKYYPSTPVWLIASASFLIAILIVAVGEVAFVEISYWNFKRRMKNKDFGVEPYYESRFFISSDTEPNKVIKMLADHFELSTIQQAGYQDFYFEHKLYDYSGRKGKIRLRKRNRENGEGHVQTVQIIYTRAYEACRKKLDQCRYFPIRKEKIYFFLDQEMPESIDMIKNKKVRSFLKKVTTKNEPHKVKFTRIAAHNEELFISTDKVHGTNPFYLLEIKTHKDIKLMIGAMRFIMRELPVIQTTHGKQELVFR